MSLSIKKGDRVRVRCGRDKGRVSRVLEVFRGEDGHVEKLLVEHVNMIHRHTRAAANRQGGIIEREAPIHVSNVMLVDPKTEESTRYGVKIGEDGRKVRVSKKSGSVL